MKKPLSQIYSIDTPIELDRFIRDIKAYLRSRESEDMRPMISAALDHLFATERGDMIKLDSAYRVCRKRGTPKSKADYEAVFLKTQYRIKCDLKGLPQDELNGWL